MLTQTFQVGDRVKFYRTSDQGTVVEVNDVRNHHDIDWTHLFGHVTQYVVKWDDQSTSYEPSHKLEQL